MASKNDNIMLLDTIFTYMVHFLTGDYPYSVELQCFWMALGGHLMVKRGPNKDNTLNWFHAFLWGTLLSFGGGLLAPIWMGRPSALLVNDIALGSLILSYIMVNVTPFNIGYHVGNSTLASFGITIWSTLFKTMGIVSYSMNAHAAFQANPSVYYPIPIFGPIVWPTLLGNMSGFFMNGFHPHLQHGMPFPFQNDGPIGTTLRFMIQSLHPQIQLGLDDKTFAICCVSAFMQIVFLLQMPMFLGPSFSPFVSVQSMFMTVLKTIVGVGTSSSFTTTKSITTSSQPQPQPPQPKLKQKEQELVIMKKSTTTTNKLSNGNNNNNDDASVVEASATTTTTTKKSRNRRKNKTKTQ